ncbi:MAG: [FeFe] hydrogenase H-cluster radical SAM maturase HydE [Lachnospiraceae bacterium]|nr:[FeFe] hydrogenase H-cluster radical SAM maturase HydE [Candidatus Equihabitans merdae]
MSHVKHLIEKLSREHILTLEEYLAIITEADQEDTAFLFDKADALRRQTYGVDVYVRGLIEFSNYCRNDCFYCGIRCSNRNCDRYRLTKEDILSCCRVGYELGYRTYVLQGGEDPHYSVDDIADIVSAIKKQHPDCALTLSIGEHPREAYAKWKEAGADRYLLRHETATKSHYDSLHPEKMSFDNRLRCLRDLKELGYQVGCGFMVGSPNQTSDHLAAELLFLKKFGPDMVGIGPFIPQKDTPFGDQKAGTLEQTLLMLGLIRLTLPDVLLPATTALGTIHPQGRELGIKAGANVCMPNLSPVSVRKKYALYDNKICTGDEAAECRNCLSNRMARIGYRVVTARGDRIICK